MGGYKKVVDIKPLSDLYILPWTHSSLSSTAPR